MVGQRIFPDPRIALFETPSSPLPRLGQPVLEPRPIIFVEPREDPRNPLPVIVDVRFHVFLPRANYFIARDLGYFMLSNIGPGYFRPPLAQTTPLAKFATLRALARCGCWPDPTPTRNRRT